MARGPARAVGGVVIFGSVAIVGCQYQPTRIWDLPRWSSGLPLPVERSDFQAADRETPTTLDRVQPSSSGSVLLEGVLEEQQAVRDLVDAHGLPDGVLVTHGPQLNLFYLSEDRVHVFAVENTQLHLVGSEALASADRAALDREAYLGQAAHYLHDNLAKLARVMATFRRVRAAVPSTGEPGYDYGVKLIDADPPARRLFGLDDQTTGVVVAIVDPHGAAATTLRAGDVVQEVDGHPVTSTRDLELPDRGPLQLRLAGPSPRHVILEPETVPVAATVVLGEWALPTARATTDRVLVTTGMVDMVENDDQLAVALGHELAHISEGHTNLSLATILRRNLSAGLLLPARVVPVVGSMLAATVAEAGTAFDREQERTADRLGIEFAARAGYDPKAAIRLLQLVQSHPLLDKEAARTGTLVPFPERIKDARRTIAALPAQPSP